MKTHEHYLYQTPTIEVYKMEVETCIASSITNETVDLLPEEEF